MYGKIGAEIYFHYKVVASLLGRGQIFPLKVSLGADGFQALCMIEVV